MPESKQLLVELQQIGLKIDKRVILEHINLSVRAGELLTIIGPNGAGKSSLIKIILGLLQASTGKVTVNKGLRIGYMPQALRIEALMPLNVRRFLRLAPRADAAKTSMIANELGLNPYLDTQLQAISGGEMQRVLLARALLNEPELLVLDEPAQGIDINGQAELYQLISNLRTKLGCGIIMVSHDLHLVIAGADQVVCLNKHICCSGHPATVMQHPEFIQLFGSDVAAGLAVYTHKHDHQHDLEGNIVHD